MNRTIAVIDDDVYIGGHDRAGFEEGGYLVLRAYSGTEALLLLDQKRPDLILLDLMLPGLREKSFCQRFQTFLSL